MPKKKDHGQAEDVVQEETTAPAPEAEQPEKKAADAPETESEDQEEAAEENSEEEDPAENTAGQDPAEEAPAGDEPAVQTPAANDETASLRAELLEARSQLAAYAAGVAPDMVADAVTLATAEAQRAGEVTEAAITQAMANVLKRHSEWKADAAKSGAKKTGGFKLGADRDNAGTAKRPAGNNQSVKRWNRFK